jgi:hypothetical protein
LRDHLMKKSKVDKLSWPSPVKFAEQIRQESGESDNPSPYYKGCNLNYNRTVSKYGTHGLNW